MDQVRDWLTLSKGFLSDQGWAYGSMPPSDGDPGRFHGLFGRDSLIFALQMLPAGPEIAVATLRALAARQGRTDDPEIDEEPGKILHEYRPVAPDWLIKLGWPVRDGQLTYYGSADSTSWFLVVLAAVGDRGLLAELDANWRAAAGWLERTLERGGGLVRYGPRTHPGGLDDQGWRDAWDPELSEHGGGIVRIDGTAPTPPIADVDSQAVAVAALRALATIDPARRSHWEQAAASLRTRLSERFGPDVMAWEADDRAVPGAGSQLGWLLWADALDQDGLDIAAERLIRPDVLTPFGLRTLSSDHPRFGVDLYHRGGVWPFDNWLGWAGLRAHGHLEAAERVRLGVLEALDVLGQAHELYAVTLDGAVRPFPIANHLQAWTVGAGYALQSEWDGRPA